MWIWIEILATFTTGEPNESATDTRKETAVATCDRPMNLILSNIIKVHMRKFSSSVERLWASFTFRTARKEMRRNGAVCLKVNDLPKYRIRIHFISYGLCSSAAAATLAFVEERNNSNIDDIA